ncbi:MAG TPA: triose-phosphate isomerase [Vicinamibacterales bacterium]|jgi:triosephosphate isomerase|nr:triose-phosphate isomerase [Acidobacteriota bacterium]HQX82676.1 triose-phosphate isomerase [Vicinamibacterales bacterium]
MRIPVFAANWKMNKSGLEAVAWVREFALLTRELSADAAEVVIAPPFTAIAAAAEAVHGSHHTVAGQNLHFEREGAFTGEVSAGMLKAAGALSVIIGHSERRRLFGETDEWVQRKVAAAHGAGLTPIVCVGETLDERERGDTLTVLDAQVRAGLDGCSGDQIGALIVAYEPVWAIGTGKNATAAEAGEAHAHIRRRLREWFGGAHADRTRILYGGSVKPENIRELIGLADVDGALVGGASLDAASFALIVQKATS